jgi:hypothetical protein
MEDLCGAKFEKLHTEFNPVNSQKCSAPCISFWNAAPQLFCKSVIVTRKPA